MTTILWHAFFGDRVPERYARFLAEALDFKKEDLPNAIKSGLVKTIGAGLESKSLFKFFKREQEVERILAKLEKIEKLLQELLKKR